MTLKTLTLSALAASALILSGCGGSYDTTNHGTEVAIEPTYNFLGIVKTTSDAYAHSDSVLASLSSDDVWARRDFSGDNISFLWGAITLKDY